MSATTTCTSTGAFSASGALAAAAACERPNMRPDIEPREFEGNEDEDEEEAEEKKSPWWKLERPRRCR